MITLSEPCDKVVAALFVANDNLGDLKRNASNPHFKSKYADLGATCDAIQPGLDAGKLIVIQAPLTAPDGAVGVETMILHASGQWVRPDPLFLPLAKADPQGAGSAITYARRYALAAFFNLAPEDDDAERATRYPGTDAARARRGPAQPPAPGPDPNALLLKAVERGVIPSPDRLMFKEWARTKVAGCADIADNAPLTPAHIAAITKALDRPLRAVEDDEASGPMTPRTRGRLFALFDERLSPEKEDQLVFAAEHGVVVTSRAQITEPQARILIRKLELIPPQPDPDDVLLDYAKGKLA